MEFERIQKDRFENKAGLRVTSEQKRYVCEDLNEFVREWRDVARFDCFWIKSGGRHVGFFALDGGQKRHPHLELTSAAVLRCFFIDERYQGHGYASATLARLGTLLCEAYPDLRTCYLTVNVRNEAAIAVYLKAGFQITGAPYLGGAHGPQHVMALQVQDLQQASPAAPREN